MTAGHSWGGGDFDTTSIWKAYRREIKHLYTILVIGVETGQEVIAIEDFGRGLAKARRARDLAIKEAEKR